MRYRVRITEQLPSEECIVEAESENEALNIRQRDLVEWADMVGLRVDLASESYPTVDHRRNR